MAVSYDKLWDILRERQMLKTDLIREAKITTNAMVLEPGGIDHSESSRNNQSELIKNSQCTLHG